MNNNVCAQSVRVFVVAMPLVRWGLERLVQSAHPHYEVAGTAAEVADSLPALQRQSCDVVLLVVDALRTEYLADYCNKCGAKVLLVTSSGEDAWLDSAVVAGVRGIVRTGEAPETLLKAIDKVNDGELWIDRGATSRIFMEMARHKAAERDDPERSRIATLTVRERQTIAAVTSDASAPGKVIAGRLCISEHTLRNHLTSIYNKLGLSNRLDLYAYATRHSLHELR
jgi:two-component system, NarL family, nitrate/nitrite response regulator NarL